MDKLDWLELNCDNDSKRCHICKRKEGCVYNSENKHKIGKLTREEVRKRTGT